MIYLAVLAKSSRLISGFISLSLDSSVACISLRQSDLEVTFIAVAEVLVAKFDYRY
jgi:hypothetical protein